MSNALAAMYRCAIQDFLDGKISSGKLIELIPGLDDSKYQKMFNELAEGDVARIDADKARIKQLETCMTKIDEIRNSIVGYHQINWSAHIYPLVAALEEAGYEGIGYEEASKLAHTQLDRIKELEADRDQWRHKFNMLQHDFTENQRIHNSERNIDSAERDRLQERVRELEGFNRDMNAIIQRDIRTLEQQRITALEAELAEAKALSTHAHEMWDRSNVSFTTHAYLRARYLKSTTR